MRRLSLGAVAGLCSMLAAAGTANAAPMDFALSRLRIGNEAGGCDAGAGLYCPDQALFQRLMLQFGTAMTLPAPSTAATLGARGFYVGVDTTLTTIDADQNQWRRGTDGDARSVGELANTDPSGTLMWNRVVVRKGLPFGLEIDASLAQAASTDAWLVGLGVKWAIVEGFRTGLGRLPDLALRAALASAAGTHDASLTVVTVDLLLSKPYVIDRSWVVSPMLALQGGWLFADSDLVDLTPEVDAVAECRPRPGHQLPTATSGGATLGCLGDGTDYGNTVVFERLRRFSLRLSAATELRYRRFVVRASLTYDALSPEIDHSPDPYPALSRQLSMSFGLGAVF